MQTVFLIIFSVLLLNFNNKTSDNDITIGTYTFTFPSDFKLVKEKGIDSYVGKIKGDAITFEFDYGYYSNPLTQTQQEYLEDSLWLFNAGDQFMKKGVTYDRRNYPKVEFLSMHPATDKDKIKFGNADFIAVCKHDSLIFDYPVIIPYSIKQHLISVDTIQNHFRKVVIAKNPSKGITGIYLRDLNGFDNNVNSYLALSMATSNLTKGQQDMVLKVFSTLKIKKE